MWFEAICMGASAVMNVMLKAVYTSYLIQTAQVLCKILLLAIRAAHLLHITDSCAVLFVAVHDDMLSEDALNEDDNSKHVSSTFRGVYKRKFDTKWRAEITAGTP